MQKVTKTKPTAEQMYLEAIRKKVCLFKSKESRQLVYAMLIDKGFACRRSSTTGQRLHPEYVTDFEGEYHVGFGNTDYETIWKVLYKLEVLN